ECSMYRSRVHDVGHELNPHGLFAFDSGGSCSSVPVAEPVPLMVFDMLGTLPPTAFAETHAVERGAGRVHLVLDATPLDEPLTATGLTDSQLGGPCVYKTGEDAIGRCLPPFANGGQYFLDGFSDSACKEPALVVETCFAPAVPAAVTLVGGVNQVESV